MAKETLAELETKIQKLEAKYQEELEKERETKKAKELKQKLLLLKYRRQLAMLDRAGKSAKTFTVSLIKYGTKALKVVNSYAVKLEAQEQAANKKKRKVKS